MSCFAEGVSFFRLRELPGVELRDIEHCSRAGWSFCTEFELMVPETFSARVWYRRRVYWLAPGQIFCAAPGEIVKVVDVQRPGALRILTLGPELLLSDPEKRAGRNHSESLPTVTLMIPFRSAALGHAFQALQTQQPIRLRSAIAALLDSIREGPCACRSSSEGYLNVNPMCSCESRARSRQAAGAQSRLSRADLSRFQALRRFKHRYGLPPHAYQLCVRIAQAKQLLRSGGSPSRVAITQGFVDQSHFARHFKRLVGVTPHEYACLGDTRSSRRSRRSGG